MKPELFAVRFLGLDLSVSSYGVFVVLGVLGFLAVFRWTSGWSWRRASALTLAVAIGAVAGARLTYLGLAAADPRWPRFLFFWEGGLVSYGALAGGGAVAVLWTRGRALGVLDSMAPASALGFAVGRVGCLLNGCCWGRACEAGEWGVRYPEGSLPWLWRQQAGADPAAPLHAVPIYLGAGGLALALAAEASRRAGAPGLATGVFLSGYGALRLVVRGFRGDLDPAAPYTLWVPVACLALGLAASVQALLRRARARKGVPGAPPGPDRRT